jgi:hypothetical protein
MRLRRNHLRVSFLILGLVIGSTSFIPSQSVSAATCDYEFFALNNITGYDACSDTCSVSSTTGGLTTPAPSSLTGTSNVEKTWNYLRIADLHLLLRLERWEIWSKNRPE